jgi:hypothetical protein
MWWNSVVKLWEYQCRSVFRWHASMFLVLRYYDQSHAKTVSRCEESKGLVSLRPQLHPPRHSIGLPKTNKGYIAQQVAY